MALATVHRLHIFTDFLWLKPGWARTYLWTNLPNGEAYDIDMNPFNTGSAPTTTKSTFVELEITRVWRRTRQIVQSGGGIKLVKDIEWQVKNVGQDQCYSQAILLVYK